MILAIVGAIIFGFFIYNVPESYIGLYSILPFDMSWMEKLFHTKLQLGMFSYIQYVSGAIPLSYVWRLYAEYYRSKRVKSKEDERTSFKESAKYEKTKKNRFALTAKAQRKWRAQKEINKLLLGITEKGHPYYIDFKEINQHMFLPATTGGGKTILLLNFVEYALMKNYPFIFIDGKGSLESIEEVEQLCKMYKKDLKVFSDSGNLTYNPLKYGNATVIKDKLEELVKTESGYYTDISLSLIQALINFIDDYGFERDLWTFARFLDPSQIKQVLNNDLVEIEEEVETSNEKFSSFLDEAAAGEEEESKDEIVPKGEEEVKEEVASSQEFSSFLDEFEPEEDKASNQEFSSFLDEAVEEKSEVKPSVNLEKQSVEEEEAGTTPKTKKKKVRSERAEKHYERFFSRYAYEQDGEDYLFLNASSVRTQIYLLLDSELGHLFKEKPDGLDLIRVSDEKEALFVSFDGLVYDNFIKVVARFLILDLNFLVSHRNRNKMKDQPMLAIYDEFSVYANHKIVDTINKSRSGGFHCIIATQTIADLEKVESTLGRQIIGNTNTYAIGQTNNPEEVESWANNLGTFKDVDLTVTTDKRDSFSMERVDLKADRGTARNVQKYKISPDEIRALRQGQFIFSRKAAKEEVEPEIVYVRNPLVK